MVADDPSEVGILKIEHWCNGNINKIGKIVDQWRGTYLDSIFFWD
jgi:hypothetical protein